MKHKIGYLSVLLTISISTAFAHGGSGNIEKPKKRVTINESEQKIEKKVDENEIAGKLIQKKIIDGFDFRLKVVDVSDSVPDGGSHNLLVNIKRNGRVQNNLSITAKVDHLNGMIKSKSMMELGDWYLAGYNLNNEEKYLITISFKTTDGVNHNSTISYP